MMTNETIGILAAISIPVILVLFVIGWTCLFGFDKD